MSEENLYNQFIDSVAVVSRTDKKGIITFVNDFFCETSGYKKDELIGKNHNIVRHPNTPKEFFKNMWETILSANSWHGVIKNQTKSNNEYYINSTIFPILDDNEEIIEFMNIGFIVTDEEQVITKLKKYIVNQKTEKMQHDKELNLAIEQKIQDAIKNELIKNQKLKEFIIEVEKELNEYRTKSHNLGKQNSTLHSQIKDLEYSLENERKRNKEIVQKVSIERTELLKKMENSVKSVKSMEEKLKKAQDGIVVFQGYVDEYRAKIDNLNDVIASLEKDLAEAKTPK